MWKEDIVNEACQRFQGTESSLQLSGGFYQNVYEYERDGETCILKLIPIATKDRNLVYSELQWVSFLRSHGISIPRQILSARGQTVETIQRLPVPCCAISFKKATGKEVDVKNPEEWNEQLFHHWGRLMGKMHALSQPFQEQEADTTFEEWDEGEIYYRDLSFAQGTILDRWTQLLETVNTFPRTPETYGLIHNDLHQRNFLVNGEELTVFDFNHVKFHWFTYDIAIALYHAMQNLKDAEKLDFKRPFLQAFSSGYVLEHPLEGRWMEQVEFFVEFHHIFRYLYLSSYLNMGQADEEMSNQLLKMKWQLESGKRFMPRTFYR